MNLGDLSQTDFKALVNGIVDDRLCELLGDPDLGLPLDETVRTRLKESLASWEFFYPAKKPLENSYSRKARLQGFILGTAGGRIKKMREKFVCMVQ